VSAADPVYDAVFSFQEGLSGRRELKEMDAVVYDFLLKDIYPDKEFTVSWGAIKLATVVLKTN